MFSDFKEPLSFLADFSTVLAALVGFAAIIVHRKEIFKSSLAQTQVKNLSKVLETVQTVCLDLKILLVSIEGVKLMGWSVSEFKEASPDDWGVYLRYQRNCTELLQQLSFASNYVFPEWVDRKVVESALDELKEFSPFTVHSLQSKSPKEIESFTQALLRVVNYFESKILENV